MKKRLNPKRETIRVYITGFKYSNQATAHIVYENIHFTTRLSKSDNLRNEIINSFDFTPEGIFLNNVYYIKYNFYAISLLEDFRNYIDVQYSPIIANTLFAGCVTPPAKFHILRVKKIYHLFI